MRSIFFIWFVNKTLDHNHVFKFKISTIVKRTKKKTSNANVMNDKTSMSTETTQKLKCVSLNWTYFSEIDIFSFPCGNKRLK